jgi:hypothetical protein
MLMVRLRRKSVLTAAAAVLFCLSLAFAPLLQRGLPEPTWR